MSSISSNTSLVDRSPSNPSLIKITNLIYGLHALSLLIGILTTAWIVTAFIFGIPSIIAVVLNYLKQDEVQGSYLESHFRWQIRTFWLGIIWFFVGWILVFTFIGIPFALAVFSALSIWFIYRIAHGWIKLRKHQPMLF